MAESHPGSRTPPCLLPWPDRGPDANRRSQEGDEFVVGHGSSWLPESLGDAKERVRRNDPLAGGPIERPLHRLHDGRAGPIGFPLGICVQPLRQMDWEAIPDRPKAVGLGKPLEISLPTLVRLLGQRTLGMDKVQVDDRGDGVVAAVGCGVAGTLIHELVPTIDGRLFASATLGKLLLLAVDLDVPPPI